MRARPVPIPVPVLIVRPRSGDLSLALSPSLCLHAVSFSFVFSFGFSSAFALALACSPSETATMRRVTFLAGSSTRSPTTRAPSACFPCPFVSPDSSACFALEEAAIPGGPCEDANGEDGYGEDAEDAATDGAEIAQEASEAPAARAPSESFGVRGACAASPPPATAPALAPVETATMCARFGVLNRSSQPP